MLLQSTLPTCDSHQARQPRTRLQLSTTDLFAPPATRPSQQASSPFINIFNACRSLHAFILDPAPAPAPLMTSCGVARLPTPPLSHAPSPTKLRLRSPLTVKPDMPRKRIVKRAPPSKRRRALDDDMGRHDDVSFSSSASDTEPSDVDSDMDLSEPRTPTALAPAPAPALAPAAVFAPSGPCTPKRTRLAPEAIPLGLERRDFHDLYLMNAAAAPAAAPAEDRAPPPPGTDVEMEADGSAWTAEDDRMLVELVLEKLKLSKAEWQECARSLGKDRHSLGRRWKTLMAQSDVGLKSKTSRRARLHSTWR